MISKGAFGGIVYPAQNCEPRPSRYRIVLAKNARLVPAIIHLVVDEPAQLHPTDLKTALDVILNRIIDVELVGILQDYIRLFVETDAQVTDYSITFNALNVARHSLTGKRPAQATTADQPIYIRSLDVVGSDSFYVNRRAGQPISNSLAAMLR